MRISDWSSDVCSSDLQPLRGEQQISLPGELSTALSSERKLPACRDTTRCGEWRLRHGMGSGSSAGCSPAKRHRWEEVENPVSSDFDLKARQATKGCLWLVGSRSEEHTSELQSLMRISYAVFCLKQKQQYNNDKNPA